MILGGGISGLIALHYIKDSVLFEASNDIAKDFLDNVFPKFIHYNAKTESLFEELDLKVKIKKFRVGIYENGMIYDFFDDTFKKEKRIEVYNKYCMKKYGKIVEDKMNGYLSGNFERDYIENKFELVDAIKNKYSDRIVFNHRVDKIDLESKTVYFNNDLFSDSFDVKYDKLISTLPVDIFSRVSRSKFTYNFVELKMATVFVGENSKLKYLDSWDFIYVTDGQYPFHRIIINKANNCLIFEFSDMIKDISECVNFAKYFYTEVGAYSFRDFKFAVLKDNKTEIYIPDVYFIGRFSTGNYAVKIQEVIDGAKSISKSI
jgi:hypothetical protein